MRTLKIKLTGLRKQKERFLHCQLDILEQMSVAYLRDKDQQLALGSFTLVNDLYAKYRILFPGLNSGILNDAMRNFDSIVRQYIVACKKSHRLVKFPDRVQPCINLDTERFSFFLDETSKSYWDAWLRVHGINFPIRLCDYHKKQLNLAVKFHHSKITRSKEGQLWLFLVFTIPRKQEHAGGNVIGVDLGIVRSIVCSDGHMIGNGKRICHTKKEYSKRRTRQQSNSKTITSKQFRWTQDTNHKLSRELIEYALKTDTGVLVLEDLKGKELSNRKYRKYTWAYKDLIEKVKYKAEVYGIEVINVNPAYTSQTCSACGLKLSSNRKSQGLYSCECGFKGNADVNAAINILNLSVKNGVHVNPPRSKALNSKL